MMKNKKEIPKHLKKNLEGFEDFLDSMTENHPLIKPDDRQEDEFYIQNHLELEEVRLDKILLFFRDKTEILHSFPHIEGLMKNQVKSLVLIKRQILDEVRDPESLFQGKLAALFNRAFGIITENDQELLAHQHA